MLPSELVLERRAQDDDTVMLATDGAGPEAVIVLMTPPITADYWMYRVVVCDGQAILGFPKFTTIGIGFAVEEDWNTNLPFSAPTLQIANHIWHNRGPLPEDTPSFDLVVAAIKLIQDAAASDREGNHHGM